MLKNKLLIFAAIVAGFCSVQSAIYADVGINVKIKVKTAVTSCAGNNPVCSSTVSGIGVLPHFDRSKEEKITSLGTVDQEQQEELIDLPEQKNEFFIYEYVPTKGELAHKKVFITFHNVQPEKGPYAGKTQIKIYKQLEKDKPTQWQLLGWFFLKPGESLEKRSFWFNPEGDFQSVKIDEKA